jgi:hypothetical protein
MRERQDEYKNITANLHHPSYLPRQEIVTPDCTVATNTINTPATSISPIINSSTSTSTSNTTTNNHWHSTTYSKGHSSNNIHYHHPISSPPKKKNNYHQKEGRIHIGASVYARIGAYKVDTNPKRKRRSKGKVNGVVVSSKSPNEWLVSFVNGHTKVMKSTQLFLHRGGKDPSPPKENKDEEPFISSPPSFAFHSPMSRDKMINDSDDDEHVINLPSTKTKKTKMVNKPAKQL